MPSSASAPPPAAPPAPPLAALIAALIEKAANRHLRADPDVAARLGAMHGKVIGVRLTAPAIELFFMPRRGGVSVAPDCEREPDTWVAGGAADLLRLGFADHAGLHGAGARAEISGDVALGQAFQQVFRDIEFDAEEYIAPYLGDALAHEVGRGARAAAAWLARAFDSLADSGGEYLREEAGAAPGEHELQDFIRRVDELRDAVERLEARMARWPQTAPGAAPGTPPNTPPNPPPGAAHTPHSPH